MQWTCKCLLIGALCMGAGSLGWAQKTDGAVEEQQAPAATATVAADNGATRALSTAQLKRGLKSGSKRLKKLLKKADWADDSCLVRMALELGDFAGNIYAANASTDAGAQGLGKNYLDKYKGYLGTYQNKAPLEKQEMAPPVAPYQQVLAHDAFAQMVRSYMFLMGIEKQSKSVWGDQEFVDRVKLEVNAVASAAQEYMALDPANYGRVERYTETGTKYDALWAERMDLPMQLEIAQKSLATHAGPFQTLTQAGRMMEDHAAFLRANQAFDWEEMRRQIVFMNAWEFRPRGGDATSAEIQRWVANWPADNKIYLEKQITLAESMITGSTVPYEQWQAAERSLALRQAGKLIYPSDAGFSTSIAQAEAVAAKLKKAYDASLTSDYHRQNIGGMGLSTTGAIGFQALTSFKAGERVILTLFLDRPAELLSTTGKFELKLEGIADHAETIGFRVAPADLGKNYIDIVLLGDKPYGTDTRMAEEAILGALCLAEGRSVKLSLSSKSSVPGRTSYGAPLHVTFDGTSAAGIATYRSRWTKLTGGH